MGQRPLPIPRKVHYLHYRCQATETKYKNAQVFLPPWRSARLTVTAACCGLDSFILVLVRDTLFARNRIMLKCRLKLDTRRCIPFGAALHLGTDKGCASGNFRELLSEEAVWTSAPSDGTSSIEPHTSTAVDTVSTAPMVKPLAFKGDKKSKKRKHRETGDGQDSSTALATTAQVTATADEDDSWVTADAPGDITGPIIFALPTVPPTCIASDANGKVFTSEIENIVEGDLATAEPYDVRQVWVANRVAGTEHISFKGHHGR